MFRLQSGHKELQLRYISKWSLLDPLINALLMKNVVTGMQTLSNSRRKSIPQAHPDGYGTLLCILGNNPYLKNRAFPLARLSSYTMEYCIHCDRWITRYTICSRDRREHSWYSPWSESKKKIIQTAVVYSGDRHGIIVQNILWWGQWARLLERLRATAETKVLLIMITADTGSIWNFMSLKPPVI